MRELAGKVAVITGAASGIGLALSRRLGADGMRLMLADVDEPALSAAARSLEADGAQTAALVTDVSDPDSVGRLARATLDRFGAVHVVCNNAGVTRGGRVWEIPLPTWNWIVSVNLFGVVHGIQAFLPHLIAQGEGHIVNTASVSGLVASPNTGPYCATKHAVVALSESVCQELAAIGSAVGVSVLCPGMVRTKLHESYDHWLDRFGPRPVVQDSPSIAEWRRKSAAMIESGTDPAVIATAVRDAIVGNRFWILTHPEYSDALLARYHGVRDGRTPVAGALGSPAS
jgi:NAD(P)-dependent dehydrogenase (short-subunit alcohol dehydrogenase family)